MYNNNLTTSGAKQSSGQLTIESLAAQVKLLQERVEFLECAIIGRRISQPHKERISSNHFVMTAEQQAMFDRAISAGLMERIYESRYHWLASKALLAYFCGRVFCGDYAQDGAWMCGKGRLPATTVERLFSVGNIGRYRRNRVLLRAPKNHEFVDAVCQ